MNTEKYGVKEALKLGGGHVGSMPDVAAASLPLKGALAAPAAVRTPCAECWLNPAASFLVERASRPTFCDCGYL